MKKMPTNSASSYPRHRTIASNAKIASTQCPQCGTAVHRHAHYCSKCGAALTICDRCRSINIAFGSFCHMCGHSMIVPLPPSKIAKVVTWETRDFDVLDQAVLSIIRLRGGLISLSETSAALGVSPDDISESIQRLELAHQIEPAGSEPWI